MPKSRLTSLKNRPTLGALSQIPIPPAAGGYTRLIITSTFTWHKEKDGWNKIKYVSKSAVAEVTEINYCKLWCLTLYKIFWNHLGLENLEKRVRLYFISRGKGSNGLDPALLQVFEGISIQWRDNGNAVSNSTGPWFELQDFGQDNCAITRYFLIGK